MGDAINMEINVRTRIGAVVIGRNEGQRLITCLESIIGLIDHVVYVDSGSTDNSVHNAKVLGVETITLDMSIPFTAARARNEGACLLLSQNKDIAAIQFIDGDCEMQPLWLATALYFLDTHDRYGVACGRRRERVPEQSMYNQLCDIEWDTPVGDAMACGGDALIRVNAFNQVSGYREDLIAGEEPEMCFRLRQAGWKIRRLDAEMTLHDAAITKMIQWWKRSVRAGYAFALGSSIHGHSEEKYWVKETRRIMFWGIFLPILTLILTLYNSFFLLLMCMYFIQIVRVGLYRPDLGWFKFVWSVCVVLGKFPEVIGALHFWSNKITVSTAKIIEYK
jgi:GT2 family glycosyltransferase